MANDPDVDTARAAPPLVLTFQSDVIYGHVGLAAWRMLAPKMGVQLLGLPTILLPHHPGHGRITAPASPPATLEAWLEALEAQGLLAQVVAIQSGYLADGAQAEVIAACVDRLKARRPGLPFWLDPVMGDLPKGLYVPDGVVRAIRTTLLPRADVVTPNAFEAEVLTGQTVSDEADAIAAAAKLGRAEAIITSLVRGEELGAIWIARGRADSAYAPRRAQVPGGAGDAFAALCLFGRLKHFSRRIALEHAIRTLAEAFARGAAPGRPPELPWV